MRVGLCVVSMVALSCGRIGFDARDEARPGPCRGERCADVDGGQGHDASAPERDAAVPPDAGDVDAGLLRDDGGGPALDAGTRTDDAGSSDAGAPHAAPSPCPSLVGPWTVTTPEPMVALNSAKYEGGVALTADALTLYFSSTRSGAQRDIYRSRRASLSSAWGAPVAVEGGIDTALDETHFAPFADGLTAVLARDNPSSDLYLGTRSSQFDVWSTFTKIATLSSAANEWDPWPSPDGLRLVLTLSTLPGGPGGKDLALSTRIGTSAAFGAPVALGVDTADDESAPALTEDERFLVFVRETAGDGGDLFYAVRDARDAPFADASPLDAVNTDGAEGEPALAPVACELYFTREVAGAGLDLYRVRFVPR